MFRRGGILFAAASALFAQALPEPTEVLAHARDNLIERMQRLPNYTCVQTVNRRYLRRAVQPQPLPSCREMHNEREHRAYTPEIYLTDRLRLDVKVSHGQEIGSWAGASQFESKSIFDLVGRGPFGTGAMGTFLSDIFGRGGASFEYAGKTPGGGGVPLYEYIFHVPLSASHYKVQVRHEWRPIPYEGIVRIDPRSFDLRHLLVRTSELPPEAETCETATSVDYERFHIGTSDFLLPQQSNLHLLMTDTYESDTTTAYTGCREYHGEATIRFGDEPPATGGPQPEATTPVNLPAGLQLSVALAAPIDTDIAAAGDVIIEKVSKPVRLRGSVEVWIPAGATVRGRIIRMEHWTAPPTRFDIAIRLETLEVRGISAPIFAKPDRAAGGVPRRKRPAILPPAGQPASVATFVFKTSRDRFVVPQGTESDWITLEPPPKP